MSKMDQNDAQELSSNKPSEYEMKERLRELKKHKELYENYRQEFREKGINEVLIIDPDARLMAVNNNGVDVCYNVQTVVDSKYKLVVDCDVINNPTDHG
jgi:Uma2 family endonuclease